MTQVSARPSWTFSAASRRTTTWFVHSLAWCIAGWMRVSGATWPATLPRRLGTNCRWGEMNPLCYIRDGYRWLVDPYAFLDQALQRDGLTFRVRLPVLGNVLMTGDEK